MRRLQQQFSKAVLVPNIGEEVAIVSFSIKSAFRVNASSRRSDKQKPLRLMKPQRAVKGIRQVTRWNRFPTGRVVLTAHKPTNMNLQRSGQSLGQVQVTP